MCIPTSTMFVRRVQFITPIEHTTGYRLETDADVQHNIKLYSTTELLYIRNDNIYTYIMFRL